MTVHNNVKDPVYWTVNPLQRETVRVLARLGEHGSTSSRDRFDIAYLIAIGCLKVLKHGSPAILEITPKGWDALAFYDSTDASTEGDG